MVRYDILGGLELALSKGESLNQAMQTFFNAGYKREDIEEAARFLQGSMENIQIPAQVILPPKVVEKPKVVEIRVPTPLIIQRPPKPEIKREIIEEIKPLEPAVKPKPLPQQVQKVEEIPRKQQLVQMPKVVQKVSGYEKKRISARAMIIIFLSAILLILLAA